jgi:ATP-dependent helicase/nuclease subunit A
LERKEVQTRKVLIGNGDMQALESMKRSFATAYPHIADTILPLKYSVTSAVEQGKDELVATYVLFDGETTDTEKGNIAHKVLEHFDFYSEESVKVQAEKMVASGIISSSELAKINLVRLENALNSGAFNQTKNATLYREKSFLVQIPAKTLIGMDSKENILLQGVIDLLVVKDECAYIIDYKYSALDKQSLKARYEKQLDLYAYAVQKSLNLKVEGKALVNLFTGETVIL